MQRLASAGETLPQELDPEASNGSKPFHPGGTILGTLSTRSFHQDPGATLESCPPQSCMAQLLLWVWGVTLPHYYFLFF